MHNVFNLQLICTECPRGMTKQNCPVFKYIADNQNLFTQSINENLITLAKPYGDAQGKYEGALMDIFNLCKQCKEEQR